MFIEVNGIQLYYETFGKGRPVILLHGNGEDHYIFQSFINYFIKQPLSSSHCLYAVDSRGHGQSSPSNTFHYAGMAKDTAAFIRQLQLRKPVIIGASDGAIVGLLLAINCPHLVSGLVLCGANTYPTGLKKRWLLLMQLGYFFTKDPKVNMMLTEPVITNRQLRSIRQPTLVLAGSQDMVVESHTRNIAHQIPNGTLQILPGETHGSYIENGGKLYHTIKPFLVSLL